MKKTNKVKGIGLQEKALQVSYDRCMEKFECVDGETASQCAGRLYRRQEYWKYFIDLNDEDYRQARLSL